MSGKELFDMDKLSETANSLQKGNEEKPNLDPAKDEKLKSIRLRESWHKIAKDNCKKRRMTLQYYIEYLIEKDKIKLYKSNI